MYIYIDESGNFGWPLKAGSEPFMVFCILVIHDRDSKSAIAQAVSRAIVDLKKYHPAYKNEPNRRMVELKGAKELSDRPDIRLKFFKRILKKASFFVYCIVLDKRVISQRLPSNYMQRYATLLLNLLYAIPIPNAQRRITMVVDSQEKAKPSKPIKVRYSSKSKRLHQNKARAQDSARRNVYNQMISGVFKQVLKRRGTHLRVRHVRSENDRCLQAVDVISHLIYEKSRLDDEKSTLYRNLFAKEGTLSKLRVNKQWHELRKKQQAWHDAFYTLNPRIKFFKKPKRLHRRIRMLTKLKRYYRRRVSRR